MKQSKICRAALATAFLFFSGWLAGQSLDSLVAASTPATADEAGRPVRIFAASRIANAQSVETLPRGILDFKIQHRFGSVEGGWESFFGLDNATTRLGLDYGISDKLEIGIGRASLYKQWDAFLKYKFMQQSSGPKGRPISLSGFASAMLQSTSDMPEGTQFSDRMYYSFQVMAARRFGNKFSVQLMPSLVHYNLAPEGADNNDVVSIGIGSSWQVTNFMSLNAEYFYNIESTKLPGTTNAIAFGIDFETSGHVFQLLMTNSQGIAERPFISEANGKFFEGDIHFGFNISRVFDLNNLFRK